MAPTTGPAAEHTGCALTLVCAGGKRLSAHACVLAAASPVLRVALALPLPKGGELRLQDAGAEWETVLPMLHHQGYPMSLVSWDNVAPLLRLADKYDMAVVRGYAADFMARNTSALSLKEPLTSPKNLLRAATLVGTYCSAPELKPYTSPIKRALGSALESLPCKTARRAAGEAAAKLKPLLQDPQYHTLVSPAVQTKVSVALAAGVIASSGSAAPVPFPLPLS